MGLDAVVYCDCYESGKLLEAPPTGCQVETGENGGLDCESNDPETLRKFDLWLHERACPHPDGILVHHHLGSVDQVAALREELLQSPIEFPMILFQVVESGTHCGDWISYPELFLLSPEVESLAALHARTPGIEPLLRRFEAQLKELLEAALRLCKPIAF